MIKRETFSGNYKGIDGGYIRSDVDAKQQALAVHTRRAAQEAHARTLSLVSSSADEPGRGDATLIRIPQGVGYNS